MKIKVFIGSSKHLRQVSDELWLKEVADVHEHKTAWYRYEGYQTDLKAIFLEMRN